MKAVYPARPCPDRGRRLARPAARGGTPVRFRPSLEVLEGRTLPSVTHYTVTDAGDGAGNAGDVTLRYAVSQAVQNNQTAVIDFSPTLAGTTITLAATQTYTGLVGATGLAIGGTANVTIDGSAAPGLTITSSTLRLFAVYSTAFLGLSDLTLSGGTAGASGGGAVYLSGTFAATDCTFANNAAGSGGAIGVHTDSQYVARATIVDCTFRHDTALFNGGAIFVAPNAQLRASGSTFADNGAQTGGAICSFGGTAAVANCTFADNAAAGSQSSSGGGVFNADGTLGIFDCTFSGNSAAGFGGAISDESGTVELDNTILANSPAGGDFYEAAPSFATVSGSNDLIGDGSFLNLFSNSLSGNAGLDPHGLQDNGGPTLTIALLAGSQALNAGDVSLIPGTITTDQRGAPRTVAGTVDIGAYEHVLAAATTTTLTASGNGLLVGRPITFTADVASAQGTPTGTVTFLVDGTAVATVDLVNGVASFRTAALSAGAHAVVARYNGLTTGFAQFAASTSAPLRQVVLAPAAPAPAQPAVVQIPLPGQRILAALAVNDAVFVVTRQAGQPAAAFVPFVNTFPLLPDPPSATYAVALRNEVSGGMPSEVAAANLDGPAAPAPANDGKTASLLDLILATDFLAD